MIKAIPIIIIFIFTISIVSAGIYTSENAFVDYDISKSVKENGCTYGTMDAKAGKGSSPHTIITKANYIRTSGTNPITFAIKTERGAFILGYKECHTAARNEMLGINTETDEIQREDVEAAGYALGYTHGYNGEGKYHYIFYSYRDRVIDDYPFHENVVDTFPKGITGDDVRHHKLTFYRDYRDGYTAGRLAR